MAAATRQPAVAGEAVLGRQLTRLDRLALARARTAHDELEHAEVGRRSPNVVESRHQLRPPSMCHLAMVQDGAVWKRNDFPGPGG